MLEYKLRRRLRKINAVVVKLQEKARKVRKEIERLEAERLAAEAEAKLAEQKLPAKTRLEKEFEKLLKRGK